MSKLILVVWLLASRDNVQMLFAVKFDTEVACQAEAAKQKDQRTGMKAFPVRYAECVMEVKK